MATIRRRLKLKDISPDYALANMSDMLKELELPDGFENGEKLPDQVDVDYDENYMVEVDEETDTVVSRL